MKTQRETIAAIATASEPAAIGIVRLSGAACVDIAQGLTGASEPPPPRHARYCALRDVAGDVLDQGLLLYFAAPASFTGEDMLELQVHGSPFVLRALLERVTQLGARLARPGEFSERAFLNGRIDLLQAEAILDIIRARSDAAARAAARSLQGRFSAQVSRLEEALIQARARCEAALDFPEEEQTQQAVAQDLARQLAQLGERLREILRRARQGQRLNARFQVVILGAPNVGKSTLYNRISGEERAIVSAEAGTTRDLLRAPVWLDRLCVELIDTAGLRTAGNAVEQEGMRRAREAAQQADLLVLARDGANPYPELEQAALAAKPRIRVLGKIDLGGPPAGWRKAADGERELALSASTGTGVDLLLEAIRAHLEEGQEQTDVFMARQRHVDALLRCQRELTEAESRAREQAGQELVAEHLRQAQRAVEELTGQVGDDAVLSAIFASFCLGK